MNNTNTTDPCRKFPTLSQNQQRLRPELMRMSLARVQDRHQLIHKEVPPVKPSPLWVICQVSTARMDALDWIIYIYVCVCVYIYIYIYIYTAVCKTFESLIHISIWIYRVHCGKGSTRKFTSSQSNVGKNVIFSKYGAWISSCVYILIIFMHDALHICIYLYQGLKSFANSTKQNPIYS